MIFPGSVTTGARSASATAYSTPVGTPATMYAAGPARRSSPTSVASSSTSVSPSTRAARVPSPVRAGACFTGSSPVRARSRELGDDEVDGARERREVVGLDRGVHRDAQL